jgi:predicted transglutaminase-like cysteine proteinase
MTENEANKAVNDAVELAKIAKALLSALVEINESVNRALATANEAIAGL